MDYYYSSRYPIHYLDFPMNCNWRNACTWKEKVSMPRQFNCRGWQKSDRLKQDSGEKFQDSKRNKNLGTIKLSRMHSFFKLSKSLLNRD